MRGAIIAVDAYELKHQACERNLLPLRFDPRGRKRLIEQKIFLKNNSRPNHP